MTRLACHCGAVVLDVKLPEEPFEPSRCNCSFCRRRGVMNIRIPAADLTLSKGAENLTLYQWNTGEAEHYFCKTCGIYTHHRTRANPSLYGINIAAVDGVNVSDFTHVPWFDGVNHPSDRTA